MKYSLIVPLYNREDTIKNCIDSLLVQEESDYEIIIVDDGSTDSSGIIADEYSKTYPFISVIHKQNGGASSARNVGLERARGEYVLFPDSDDEYKPNLLSYLNNYFGYDLICFGHDVEYSSVTEEKAIVQQSVTTNEINVKEILYLIESAGALNVPWNKAYKRSLLSGIFFKDIVPVEDLVFNCHFYAKCKTVAILKERLYRYVRKEDVSQATRYKNNLYEMIEIANLEREKLYLKLGNYDEKFDLLYSKKYAGYIFSVVPNIYRKRNGLKFKEKYKQIKQIIKDKELKKHLKRAKLGGFNGKTFRFLVWLNNGFIAHVNYSFLFFIRNNFTKLYKKLRRK